MSKARAPRRAAQRHDYSYTQCAGEYDYEYERARCRHSCCCRHRRSARAGLHESFALSAHRSAEAREGNARGTRTSRAQRLTLPLATRRGRANILDETREATRRDVTRNETKTRTAAAAQLATRPRLSYAYMSSWQPRLLIRGRDARRRLGSPQILSTADSPRVAPPIQSKHCIF